MSTRAPRAVAALAVDTPSRPLPTLTRETFPFFTGGRHGELLIYRCGDCEYWSHPPTPRCPECLSGNTERTKVSGRGTVYSYTIVHRPLARWFKDKVPLVCAVIELDEGVRMVSNVENVDPYAVTIGMPVRVIYDDVTDEITLPMFEPVPA